MTLEISQLDICPCCKRPLIKPSIFPSVTGRTRRRLVHLIAANPGMKGPQLMQLLYADNPEGGALCRKIISVLVHYARPQLAKDGYKIDYSVGRGGGYRLRRIK